MSVCSNDWKMSESKAGFYRRVGLRTKAIVAILLLLVCLIAGWGCSSGSQAEIQMSPLVEEQPAVDTTTPPAEKPKSIMELPPLKKQAEPAEKWGWIRNESINVRSQPTTKSKIVTKLHRGDKVRLIEHAGEWWQVVLDDSATAYIYSSLIFNSPYVDPWTAFRMGCRKADTSLVLITAVARSNPDDDNDMALTVADDWYDLPKEQREQLARAAYSYWRTCLDESGHDEKGAAMIVRDDIGKEILSVSGSIDKPKVQYSD